VALFTDVYPPALNGASHIVESWVRCLPQLGVTLRLFAPEGCPAGAGIAAERRYRASADRAYPGDQHAHFSAILEKRRNLRHAPDIVLVCSPGRIGLLGLTLSQVWNVPAVYVHLTDAIAYSDYYSALKAITAVAPKLVFLALAYRPTAAAILHLMMSRSGRRARLDSLVRAALAPASHFVSLSQAHASRWQMGGGSAAHAVIPAGVDRLPPADPVESADGGFRMLYVGRLGPEKNLELLVQVLAEVRMRGVPATLVFVGGGQARADLELMCRRLGVSEACCFQGPVRRRDLRAYYESADVFVFPSLTDTQALVLNEAAHESLPMVLSLPDLNDVAVDGTSALVVAPDAREYALAVERLYRDSSLRSRLGAGAKQLASQRPEMQQAQELLRLLAAVAYELPPSDRAIEGGYDD
jgi:1,2-diacylglycerol 3-alpha-glucosyltransferase